MLKSLGFGLDAGEKYRRAFEKGVLLGDYAAASRLFMDAAREYEKRGQPDGQRAALANAHLYEYLRTGKLEYLNPLIPILRQLSQIECIGSAIEFMPADKLANELEARCVEAEINALKADSPPEFVAAAHEKARDKFALIRSERLITYAHQGNDQFHETAESRFFLHSGKASWYRALPKLGVDPAAAADELSRAVMFYRRAGDHQSEEQVAQTLANLRITRTCWVCGREMQGQGVHFDYLPTTVLPYHMTVLEKSKQDASTALPDASRVAVCVVCKDLILSQARQIADALIQELVQEKLVPMAHRVDQLSDAVQALARTAHHH